MEVKRAVSRRISLGLSSLSRGIDSVIYGFAKTLSVLNRVIIY